MHRRQRTAIRAAMVVIVMAAIWPARAEERAIAVTEAKAGFLFNCALFIEWPPASATQDIQVGVIGSEPMRSALDRLDGRRVNGRIMRVRSVRSRDDLRALQILFVTGDEPKDLGDLLKRVSDAPVLTVGDQEDFTAKGGVVRLYTEDSRLRFEVNVTSAERAGLKVSAKMLNLARIVR